LNVVENDKVNGVTELLAIARTANVATRRDAPVRGRNGLSVGIDGEGGGPGADGVLPSGDLGVIHLQLSYRTHKQIEGTVNEQASRPAPATSATPARFLDSIEMLDMQSIQRAGQGAVDAE